MIMGVSSLHGLSRLLMSADVTCPDADVMWLYGGGFSKWRLPDVTMTSRLVASLCSDTGDRKLMIV